jgi:hypothetical protein
LTTMPSRANWAVTRGAPYRRREAAWTRAMCAAGDRPGSRSRSRPDGDPGRVRVEPRGRDAAQGADGKSAFWAATNAKGPHARDSFTQKAVARFRISHSTSSSATRRRSAAFSRASAGSASKRLGSARRCPAHGQSWLSAGPTIAPARPHQP